MLRVGKCGEWEKSSENLLGLAGLVAPHRWKNQIADSILSTTIDRLLPIVATLEVKIFGHTFPIRDGACWECSPLADRCVAIRVHKQTRLGAFELQCQSRFSIWRDWLRTTSAGVYGAPNFCDSTCRCWWSLPQMLDAAGEDMLVIHYAEYPRRVARCGRAPQPWRLNRADRCREWVATRGFRLGRWHGVLHRHNRLVRKTNHNAKCVRPFRYFRLFFGTARRHRNA